ncbi:MAG: hypothetical protein SH857_08840 [Chitinophagales bacterium]|nr:hypothetical protein [Chitinophagales bacterium]
MDKRLSETDRLSGGTPLGEGVSPCRCGVTHGHSSVPPYGFIVPLHRFRGTD